MRGLKGFSAQWLYALAACPQRLGDDENEIENTAKANVTSRGRADARSPLGLAALRVVSEATARAGLTTSSLCSWFLPRIDGLMACTLDPYYHEPSGPEMQSVFLNKSPRSVGVGPKGVNGVIKCLLIKKLCRRT